MVLNHLLKQEVFNTNLNLHTMKKIFFTLILFATFTSFIGCTDKDDKVEAVPTQYESTGQIVGKDTAACACCGNWIIKIDGIDNTLQFVKLPNSSTIDLNTATFPLSVSLKWAIDPNSSCGFIIIESITAI
jgi:hypothetical protein